MNKSASTKIVANAAVGRKSAYVARNRIRILLAAQEVLANLGPDSTVEAVSDKAEIAISTIHKHFETRDALFDAAMAGAMIDWEAWALNQIDGSASELQKFIKPLRLLFRIGDSHPAYAKLIAANPAVVAHALPEITARMSSNIRELVSTGVLKIEDVEIRLRNFQGAILQTFQYALQNPGGGFAEADKGLEVALGMIGVSAVQARELCSLPL